MTGLGSLSPSLSDGVLWFSRDRGVGVPWAPCCTTSPFSGGGGAEPRRKHCPGQCAAAVPLRALLSRRRGTLWLLGVVETIRHSQHWCHLGAGRVLGKAWVCASVHRLGCSAQRPVPSRSTAWSPGAWQLCEGSPGLAREHGVMDGSFLPSQSCLEFLSPLQLFVERSGQYPSPTVSLSRVLICARAAPSILTPGGLLVSSASRGHQFSCISARPALGPLHLVFHQAL